MSSVLEVKNEVNGEERERKKGERGEEEKERNGRERVLMVGSLMRYSRIDREREKRELLLRFLTWEWFGGRLKVGT